MPAPHVFALAHAQLDDDIIPNSNSGKAPRRKRKASEGVETTGNEDNDDDVATSTASQLNRLSQDTVAFTSLSADQHRQLRAAGLQPGDETPSFPFPHKRPAPRGFILRDVRKELKDLNPPLPHLDPNYYAPLPFKTNKQRTTLREQHVAVLTTLLHQMLQKGDYKRAGRAWALLLRSGNLSRHLHNRQGIAGMDLRTHDRWGIGAELLMRRAPKTPQSLQTGESEGYLDYSDVGFQLARQYYERLIVQYPRDTSIKGANASTFYAAMFSLWIYEVNERYKNGASEQSRTRSISVTSSLSDDSGAASPSSKRTSVAGGESDSPQLQDATDISKRMDDILEIPPHDQNAELLQMRGMVELWIVDLANWTGAELEIGMVRAAGFFSHAQKRGMNLTEHALQVVNDYHRENIDEEVDENDDDDDDDDETMEDE